MSRALDSLARVTALLGGVVLLALVTMTCVSVLGRAGLTLSSLADLPAFFGRLRPVRGDYELIEIGTAIAVCAFLPWCSLRAGHARVDLMGGALPTVMRRALDRLWGGAMAAALALIAWRLAVGLLAKRASGETSFLLQIPIWWGYGACLAGLVVAVIVATALALGPAERSRV